MRKSTRKPRNTTNLLLVLLFAAPVFAQPDARIPPEVLHKSGYVNPVPRPPDFHSAMLWGIAIADRRVAGFENAQIEIARVQLSCRVDGKERVLNDDRGKLRGGLYRRYPWFQTDVHEPMPEIQKESSKPVMLKVGTHPDRVWHFWAGSPRKAIPPGRLDGCTVRVRAKISRGALLQVGFDYWRNELADYGSGGNNHEAGSSGWYFPSGKWQEATFSDIRHR